MRRRAIELAVKNGVGDVIDCLVRDGQNKRGRSMQVLKDGGFECCMRSALGILSTYYDA